MTHPAPRKPFQPLDDSDIDAAVTRHAIARDIPTLTPPQPRVPDATVVEPASAALAAKITPGTSANAARTSAAPKAGPTRRPDQVTHNFLLPSYLSKDLKMKAVTDDVSVRFLVMKALRADGFHIDDADLIEDGRGHNMKRD